MGRCACQGVGAGTVVALHGVCRWGWHGVCAGVMGRWLAGVTGRADRAGVFLPGLAALPPRETLPQRTSIGTHRASPTGIPHAPRNQRASPDPPRPLTRTPAHATLPPPKGSFSLWNQSSPWIDIDQIRVIDCSGFMAWRDKIWSRKTSLFACNCCDVHLFIQFPGTSSANTRRRSPL